jgi:hypothetical protein
MKIARFDYDPSSALAFYEESLLALGALCERTWHDRLEVVAEGRAAKLWNDEGAIHSQELLFGPADTKEARDAGREVSPGCPLTFRLCDALRPSPLVLEKIILAEPAHSRAPDATVLEKLWRSQYSSTRKWRLADGIKSAFHISLLAVVRCEIQAIDQHWSLHRLALGLPGGEVDSSLAADFPMLEVDTGDEAVTWPATDPRQWCSLLRGAIEAEIHPDLASMRARQEKYLQREIQRIDDYFSSYEQELMRRSLRGAASSVKSEERLAAARAEHARRRLDQAARHEIKVQPHVDALLLVAERCWRTKIEVEEHKNTRTIPAAFVPRARKWFPELQSAYF